MIEVDDQIIGNIMYTKAKLVNGSGQEKEILTLGPVCILPEYQRKGYGKKLIDYSFEKAVALGYDVVVIFGNPSNYVGLGFKSCKKYNVHLENGSYPTAMLVKELKPGALDGRKWVYCQSSVFEIDEKKQSALTRVLNVGRRNTSQARKSFIFTAILLYSKFAYRYSNTDK